MPNRLSTLDGVRGIAALVVVLHHLLLTSAPYSAPYFSPDATSAGMPWLLTYTPLHLLWNGPSAVLVFFVLSGYVLALPAATGRPVDWFAYYPRRLIRLYAPVGVAVFVAVACALVVHRHAVTGAGEWMNLHAPPSGSGIAQDLLLFPQPGATNSVLWSLRWEVAFSLLLPLYLVAARPAKRLPAWLCCVVLTGLTQVAASSEAEPLLHYLPLFGCGVALAFAPRAAPMSRVVSFTAWSVAILGLNASWMSRLVWSRQPTGVGLLIGWIELASACAVVALSRHSVALGRLTERRVIAWLGSRSFSLYLVHEPVAVSVALVLGHRAPVTVTMALALPLALALTEGFFRYVELPSVKGARKVGSAVTTWRWRRSSAVSTELIAPLPLDSPATP